MTKAADGADFASAAMMRLVAAGLTRQGIPAPVARSATAHVPLSAKRDVLGGVLARHGPIAILSIADAAQAMAPEPVVQALRGAKDMADLMTRWQRLERFSHGRHRIVVEALRVNRFRLTHLSRDGGPPPAAAESLLVFGLLTVLAEMMGLTDVTLEGSAGEIWRSGGRWHRPEAPQGVVVLSAAGRRQPVVAVDAGHASDPVAGLRACLVADPVRRWTVADLAAVVGISSRTLQRRLAERSLTFSTLLTEARIEVAAAHLCKADGPALAEIAFLSGFADQAHFARTFSKTVGTTPGRYRADFAG